MASTIGAFVMGVGVLLATINALKSIRSGEDAGPNPWGAGTLEWATASPPAPYNFVDLPRVTGRNPLWGDVEEGPGIPNPDRPLTVSEADFPQDPTRREVIGTRLLDSQLERRIYIANSSIWPLFVAIGVAVIFLGTLYSLWFVPAGAVVTYISILGWLWPDKEEW